MQNKLYHEVANIFPMMNSEEFEALKADIATNGLIEPIWFYDGRIIDGRNRWEACQALGIEPEVREWSGDGSLVSFVVSLNLKRRHLNATQKALVGESVEPALAIEAKKQMAKGGGDRKSEEYKSGLEIFPNPISEPVHAAKEAAKIVGVNPHYITDVKRIRRDAPELIPKMQSGEMSIPEAKKVIKKRERAEYIEEQRAEIAAGNVTQPTGLYDVISLDPPWPYGREYDPEGSRVANPYPEMSIPEIRAIKIPNKPDAVIFLWTTHNFLPDAFSILAGYGAEYKATLVWDKELIGMGNWLRMQCEFCLIGIIGKPFWDNTTERDIIREARRQHSRKPDAFFALVDKITTGRKLDYFSREQREGWDNYGNEPTKF